MSSGALKVLIVEGDQAAAALFKDALVAEGHNVIAAVDGATAIEIAHSFEPDIIFLDLGLQDRDGYEVAHELRNALPPTASIIVVTDTDIPSPRIQGDIDLVLRKPVEPHMFASTIEFVRAKRAADIRRS